jgi:hypothetical protein
MTGLVPVIHAVRRAKALQGYPVGAVLRASIRPMRRPDRVDDRDQPGQDDGGAASASNIRYRAPTPVTTGLVPVIHAVGLDATLQSYRWRGVADSHSIDAGAEPRG